MSQIMSSIKLKNSTAKGICALEYPLFRSSGGFQGWGQLYEESKRWQGGGALDNFGFYLNRKEIPQCHELPP